jgi:ATP-binding cassette, subfamily G (WHITE), member 2, PDR
MLILRSVLATPTALPGFWIFMYRVSPFTYLIDGMLSVGLANTKATCADIEYLHFDPPSGATCAEYMKPYIATVGGYLTNESATSQCEFCSVADTNVFLASLSSSYEHRWRNFGIMWAFIIFNAFAAIALYWLARVPKSQKVEEGGEGMQPSEKTEGAKKKKFGLF